MKRFIKSSKIHKFGSTNLLKISQIDAELIVEENLDKLNGEGYCAKTHAHLKPFSQMGWEYGDHNLQYYSINEGLGVVVNILSMKDSKSIWDHGRWFLLDCAEEYGSYVPCWFRFEIEY